MSTDYSLLLENLKGRRYDEALREPVLSDGFGSSDYPDCVKYALESMVEIDVAYAYKVYSNARKIQEKISKELANRGWEVEYRYQGGLKTFTNVLLYGDVEIITIIRRPTEKPFEDVMKLGMELHQFLQGDPDFKSVDFSDKTRIRITALKPTCEVDILPSVWVDSGEYLKKHNEIYRGISEFDFLNKKAKKYLPFLNIARINARDQRVGGKFKSLVRLLATLCKDAEETIALRDSEINGIIYSIPEEDFEIEQGQVLSLLPKVETILEKAGTDPAFFDSLLAPSEKGKLFGGRTEKMSEIQKLHTALTGLIADLKDSLKEKGFTLESNISYSETEVEEPLSQTSPNE